MVVRLREYDVFVVLGVWFTLEKISISCCIGLRMAEFRVLSVEISGSKLFSEGFQVSRRAASSMKKENCDDLVANVSP